MMNKNIKKTGKLTEAIELKSLLCGKSVNVGRANIRGRRTHSMITHIGPT